MGHVVVNFASTELKSGINTDAKSIEVVSTDTLPLLGPGDFFYITISPPGLLPTKANAEILKVTAIKSNTLTVERAQDSTTAKVFGASAYVRVTNNVATVKEMIATGIKGVTILSDYVDDTNSTSHKFVTTTDKASITNAAKIAVASQSDVGKYLRATSLTSYTWVKISAADITVDASNRFVTDTEKNLWNAKASTAVATTTVNGLLSYTDKVKLDSYPVAGTVNNGKYLRVNASNALEWGAVQVSDIAVASTASNGLMSLEDKKKLDGIAVSANNYVHPMTDGNLHLPKAGVDNNGKYLTVVSGVGVWDKIKASDITVDASNRFVTDAEKLTWNNKAEKTPATTLSDGLLSVSDKTKLDNLKITPLVGERALLPYISAVGNVGSVGMVSNSIVVCGLAGTRLILSKDAGVSWTQSPKYAYTLSSIAIKNNKIVAVGGTTGVGFIVYSEDNGTNWVEKSIGLSNLNAVCEYPKFVAVGDNGLIVCATALSSWDTVTSKTTTNLNSVLGTASGFVAVGAGGTILESDTSATTWSNKSVSGYTVNLSCLTQCQDGTILAIPKNTSSDKVVRRSGGSWSVVSLTKAGIYNSIVSLGSTVVIVGSSILVSVNSGLNWKTATGYEGVYNAVAVIGKTFVAVGADGVAAKSVDGENWVMIPTGYTASFSGVHVSAVGVVVAYGYQAPYLMYAAKDLSSFYVPTRYLSQTDTVNPMFDALPIAIAPLGANGMGYKLPVSTRDSLGGVRVGSGLSVTPEGVLGVGVMDVQTVTNAYTLQAIDYKNILLLGTGAAVTLGTTLTIGATYLLVNGTSKAFTIQSPVAASGISVYISGVAKVSFTLKSYGIMRLLVITDTIYLVSGDVS